MNLSVGGGCLQAVIDRGSLQWGVSLEENGFAFFLSFLDLCVYLDNYLFDPDLLVLVYVSPLLLLAFWCLRTKLHLPRVGTCCRKNRAPDDGHVPGLGQVHGIGCQVRVLGFSKVRVQDLVTVR